VCGERVYLSTGSFGPVSRTWSVALRRETLEDMRQGRMDAARFAAIDAATASIRAELAAILGAENGEIALTQSTSASLETVIRGFPWQSDDEVVCTQHEHPALTLPLREAARRHGFNVSLAQVPDDNADELQWLEKCVTPRTRLIAFSGVSYTTGQLLPVARIGAFARARGIYTLLDGAQCVGAIPFDLTSLSIDFCAFPLQKWLCGPEGIGALYVRRDTVDGLGRDRLAASRGLLEGTAAHLEWMRDAIGWPWILERTQFLAAKLRAAIAATEGIRLVTPEQHAGLISFETEAGRHEAIAKKLRARRIVIRSWPEIDRYRVSTAFFNTEKEIASVARVFR
jgi:L-cysteine/cystine lyase